MLNIKDYFTQQRKHCDIDYGEEKREVFELVLAKFAKSTIGGKNVNENNIVEWIK